MAIRPEDLPSDPVLLTELVLAFDGEVDSLRATVATLKRMIFGARSERLTTIGAEQLALDLANEMRAASPAANDDEIAPGSRNPRGDAARPGRTDGDPD